MTAKKCSRCGVERPRTAPLLTITFPFNPVPASRPRVTRWGTYYGKTYAAWKTAAEKFLKPGKLNAEGELLVVVESIMKKARTSKLKYPRADVDNLAKAPLDAITKATGYWGDDNQVLHLTTTKRFAEPDEEPRTIVEIYEIQDA